MMGTTVQLDDYPYVHLMRSISNELRNLGEDGVFFDADHLPMKEPRDWGTLIELVNEDFADLTAQRIVDPRRPSFWMLERLDAARAKVGAPEPFRVMTDEVRRKLTDAISDECEAIIRDKNAVIPESLEGKTVVMEFARGGKQGSPMPLHPPYGYRYALSTLSDEILSRAAICYVWVTPEESRRKNIERARPAKAASTFMSLSHCVPEEVMLNEYGCDDMAWLIETSDMPNSVKIETRGCIHYLPVAFFDNRVDKTSFVRGDKSEWKRQDVEALHDDLAKAFKRLVEAMNHRLPQ